jgi:hypothetical protein
MNNQDLKGFPHLPYRPAHLAAGRFHKHPAAKEIFQVSEIVHSFYRSTGCLFPCRQDMRLGQERDASGDPFLARPETLFSVLHWPRLSGWKNDKERCPAQAPVISIKTRPAIGVLPIEIM